MVFKFAFNMMADEIDQFCWDINQDQNCTSCNFKMTQLI